MAKITFVYPDFESLGVEYLMAACSKAGHDVQLVYYEAEDTYIGETDRQIPYKKIALRICHTDPDIVAFSCVTDNYQYQLQCANSLKEEASNVYTIFGGIHPTAVPEKTLQNHSIDAVAIGEAEHSLLALLSSSESSGTFAFPDSPIPGIVFKRDGQMVGDYAEGQLTDLDLIPFPYKQAFYSILNNTRYEYRTITSRGCPYHCSYCFNSHMLQLRKGKVIRRRSIDNVIKELLWAKKEYSIKRVLFFDDSLTTDKRWIMDFCKHYKAEVDLPFSCIANPSYIDEEIAERLAYAGCVNIQLGIQSLSEAVCTEVLNRRSSNEKIRVAIQSLKQHNIMVQVDHMLGIPGDTLEVQEESVHLYNIYRPHLISVFWLTYYPKTTITDIALKRGLLTENDIERIEQGLRLTTESYLTGGSMKEPGAYYGISLMLNYLPLLPKWCVTLLLNSRIYRLLKIKHYFISTAFPRIIRSVFDKRDVRGRTHILRFINKVFKRNQPSKTKS